MGYGLPECINRLSSVPTTRLPMTEFDKHSDYAALVGRLFLASMFLLFGYGKLTGYTGAVGYMGSLGLPAPALFTVLATVIEIAGGLLILVGYQTRLVSLGLAIYVLVSAFIGHMQFGDLNQFQHFMKNMAIVGGLLAFFAFGGGAYSLAARSIK
jgi:putative oxidoreductase